MTMPPLSLWIGRTAHIRHQPFKRAFHYRVAMIDIDVDQLDEANETNKLFSVDSFNILAFHQKDNGPRDGSSLRDWADTQFESAGLKSRPNTVRLTTFPRIFGYAFSPLSLWYAYDDEENVAGVIYEVHNTFGEAHSYTAIVDKFEQTPRRMKMSADKQFYVSPFMDVSGKYHFTLNNPAQKLRLIVDNLSDGRRLHTASMLAHRKSVTTVNIIGQFGIRPFTGLGVMIAIHWQAFWLWLRGAGYRSRSKATTTQTNRTGLSNTSPVQHELSQGGSPAE